MKISAFMLVAGAAIVFAAPIANASQNRAVPHNKVTTPGKSIKGGTTGKAGTGAKGGKTVTTGTIKVKPQPPLYIYIPGFSVGLAATPDPTQLCFQSMENCSDQQLCENWGLNCSTAGRPTSDTTPAIAVSTVEAIELGSQLSSAVVSDAPQGAPVAASDTTASNDEYEDC
jgi:hypothetical protein